jgi:hypothetical protein
MVSDLEVTIPDRVSFEEFSKMCEILSEEMAASPRTPIVAIIATISPILINKLPFLNKFMDIPP